MNLQPQASGPELSPACLHVRACPISGSPCPGECVFAEVMQGASLGIVVLDLARRDLLFANREASRSLDLDKIDFTGLHRLFLDRLDGDVRPLPLTNLEVRSGRQLIGYSLYGSGNYRWIFFRDITEKARLESIAESVELSNSLARVFSTVRHEIGNPVNAVKMALSVLRRNLDRFPPETVNDYLDRSLAALARIEELLASLRSFSSAEEVVVERVYLTELLEDTVAFVSRGYAAAGVELTLAPGPPPSVVKADPRALRQVLPNLFANAADALEGRPDPTITVSTADLGDRVEIRVEDNGAGMSAEACREVFKPFFTTKAAGTGLGLTIVRRMLARMEGTVEMTSTQGVGTSVRLTLPVWSEP